MPYYSDKSKAALATCHPNLQLLFNEVIKHIDHSVIYGHRDIKTQKELISAGLSKTLTSKHLHSPSLAIDIAPYPINWDLVNKNQKEELYKYVFLAGFVFAVAETFSINLRWGGAWKHKYVLNAPGEFQDLGHYELIV